MTTSLQEKANSGLADSVMHRFGTALTSFRPKLVRASFLLAQWISAQTSRPTPVDEGQVGAAQTRSLGHQWTLGTRMAGLLVVVDHQPLI